MIPLPERASLDWLRKTAKQTLKALRETRPGARLADAQLAVAREHGFTSWRALKAHVERAAAPPPRPALTPDEIVGAFLQLVRDGESDRVRAALAAAPGLAHATGPHPYWGGRPQALHMAIEGGRRDLFDLLLEAGADASGLNAGYDHWSPVMLALTGRQPEMLAALLARGARIGLAEALLMSDDAAVDRLMATEGLPAEAPNRGSILAFARTPHAIDRLLAAGADATMKDRWGATPIEAMSRLGAEGADLVRHMMMRGVTPEPAEFARLGDQAGLERLARVRPEALRLDAVMMGAVDFGRHDLVRWLLARGASPDACAEAPSRHTALHSAAWNGDLAMVRLLVESGGDIHARDAEHDGEPQGWAEVSVTVTGNPNCAEVAAWLAALA